MDEKKLLAVAKKLLEDWDLEKLRMALNHMCGHGPASFDLETVQAARDVIEKLAQVQNAGR